MKARDAAERIGARAIGIGADVTDQGAMMAAVAQVVDEFGGLDCVVANAGIAQKQLATVYGMSGEEWERVVEVDLLGVFRTVRAALPQIVERRGQVAMVSSVYAFANGFGNSPYAVAKPGVEAFGRGLRVELAHHGASATVAYFGWVDTTMVKDALSQPDAERLNKTTPKFLLKRIQPEVASLVLFYSGCAFAYFVVMPAAFKFLNAVTPEGVAMMTDITHYLDFVMLMFFARTVNARA